MIIGKDNGITDKFNDGDAYRGHEFYHPRGHADFGHLNYGAGLAIAVNKQFGLVAVNADGVIPCFRLNAVEFVRNSAAELGDLNIKTFPFRQ